MLPSLSEPNFQLPGCFHEYERSYLGPDRCRGMQTETGSKWLRLPVTRLEGEGPANFRGEVKEKLRYAFFVEAPANQPGVDGVCKLGK